MIDNSEYSILHKNFKNDIHIMKKQMIELENNLNSQSIKTSDNTLSENEIRHLIQTEKHNKNTLKDIRRKKENLEREINDQELKIGEMKKKHILVYNTINSESDIMNDIQKDDENYNLEICDYI